MGKMMMPRCLDWHRHCRDMLIEMSTWLHSISIFHSDLSLFFMTGIETDANKKNQEEEGAPNLGNARITPTNHRTILIERKGLRELFLSIRPTSVCPQASK